MNPQKIKFGVLGSSRVALKGMLPAMRDSDLAEFFMMGSRHPEKGKEVATQFNCTNWGSYEDVLKNKDIDAIYISLPNALHEEWTLKALEAGKHVICEKPTAISYAAGKKMVETARKNNVRLLEGLMFRYHPQHAKVKEFVESGSLGDLVRFEGCFAYAMPDRASSAMSSTLGGGTFNDQMPYPVYSSRMIFKSEPESVLCTIETDPESGVSIKSNMMLAYPGGRIAFASSIFGSYYQSTYSVLGTKANVRMGRAYAVPRDMEIKIFLDADDKTEEIVIPPADHFRLMLDDFCVEVVKGSESTKHYEDDLLAQARILEAARISSRERRVIKISEIDDVKNKLPHVLMLPKETFKKVILTGGSGNLGRAITRSGLLKNIVAPSHSELDITKPEEIRKFFEREKPDAIIHAAAVVKMAQADKDASRVETNIIGTANLVHEVMKMKENGHNIRFIYISTDGVYEGTKGNYSESDETVPYNNYGLTKLGGEYAVRTLSNFCIIRTSFFDPNHIPFDTAATDMYSSKIPIDELPEAIAKILQSNFSGTINIGDERKSHYDKYKETKPSIKPCTFEEVTRGLNFNMARDASLDVTLWKAMKRQLEDNV